MNRRALAAGVITVAVPLSSSARTATPLASPSTGSVRLSVGGGGTVQNGRALATFMVVAWLDSAGVAGGQMRVHQNASDGIAVDIETFRIQGIASLSESDPFLVRITGWGTLNGGGEYPFALDVHDTARAKGDDATVSLVFGRDALPFFEDGPVKQCDCVGYGYNLRGPFVTGGLIVQRS